MIDADIFYWAVDLLGKVDDLALTAFKEWRASHDAFCHGMVTKEQDNAKRNLMNLAFDAKRSAFMLIRLSVELMAGLQKI